jgi:hypothetical protein
MPSPALPFPRNTRASGRCQRRYVDSLGRPLAGTVTITRRGAHVGDGVVMAAAPARVELVGGNLDVQLLPGRYELAAQLRTVDGVGTTFKDELVVEA